MTMEQSQMLLYSENFLKVTTGLQKKENSKTKGERDYKMNWEGTEFKSTSPLLDFKYIQLQTIGNNALHQVITQETCIL